MAKLAIFLAIMGFAYWYWSGPYQKSKHEADRLRENAVIMQRCIELEERLKAAGGSAGVDAERLCAETNNLYLRAGKWHSKQDH